MPKSLKFILIIAILLNEQSGLAEEVPVVQVYNKSLHHKKQIDLSAVFSDGYSEIRWDKNADGIIDYWFIKKGNLEVQEYFEKNQLKVVTIRNRSDQHHAIISYRATPNGTLKLDQSSIVPFRKQENSNPFANQNGFESPDSSAGQNGALTKSEEIPLMCRKVSSFFQLYDLQQIQEATAGFEGRAKLEGMISGECKSQMPPEQQQQLYQSLVRLYEVDFDGIVEDNPVLKCLANNEKTAGYVTLYLNKIVQGPKQDPPLLIKCNKINGTECGAASYNEKTCQIEMPISNPPCQKNMENFFSKNILHETLHSLNPKLKEGGVEALTEVCMNEVNANKLSLDLAMKVDSLKDFEDTEIVKEKAILSNPLVSDSKIAEEVAASTPVNVNAEMAAGSFAPGKVAGASSGIGSLNSAFIKPQEAGTSQNVNQIFRDSQARTTPVLSMAQSLVQKAILPLAQANTKGSEHSDGHMASAAKTSSRASMSSTSKRQRSPSSTTSQSDQVWLGRDQIKGGSGQRNIASVNEDSKFNSASKDSSGMEFSNAKSESDEVSEVKNNRSAGGGSGMGSAVSSKRGNVAAANAGAQSSLRSRSVASTQGPTQLEIRRKQMESQLMQMSSEKLWDFVKKNHETIKGLEIHILDANNQPWGVFDPEMAAVRFRERNNRLIREN